MRMETYKASLHVITGVAKIRTIVMMQKMTGIADGSKYLIHEAAFVARLRFQCTHHITLGDERPHSNRHKDLVLLPRLDVSRLVSAPLFGG